MLTSFPLQKSAQNSSKFGINYYIADSTVHIVAASTKNMHFFSKDEYLWKELETPLTKVILNYISYLAHAIIGQLTDTRENKCQ